MSLELVNTFATLGTFLVIAATAIAAVVQLRHMRGSNQIIALNELQETTESRDLQEARHFVRTELAEKVKDPAFRFQIANTQRLTAENQPAWNKITHLANSYESMGALVKNGLVDKTLVLDMFFGQIISLWDTLAPVTAILRRAEGVDLWENFEYLTALSKRWEAAHPNGTYPAGVERMQLNDDWLEADREYAASLKLA